VASKSRSHRPKEPGPHGPRRVRQGEGPHRPKGREDRASLYANFKFGDGERLALGIATVQGWGDFCRWAKSAPVRLKALHTLADTGMAKNPAKVYDEIEAAAKVKKPGPSAKAVANRLLGIGIVEGEFAVSEEPGDSELD
jgi:hypothetical protein